MKLSSSVNYRAYSCLNNCAKNKINNSRDYDPCEGANVTLTARINAWTQDQDDVSAPAIDLYKGEIVDELAISRGTAFANLVEYRRYSIHDKNEVEVPVSISPKMLDIYWKRDDMGKGFESKSISYFKNEGILSNKSSNPESVSLTLQDNFELSVPNGTVIFDDSGAGYGLYIENLSPENGPYKVTKSINRILYEKYSVPDEITGNIVWDLEHEVPVEDHVFYINAIAA